MHKQADFVIRNISQLITPQGAKPLRGEELSRLKIISSAAIASCKGKIVFVGGERDLKKNFSFSRLPKKKIIDANGAVAMPGFVDPHTHLVFGGFREKEFAMRLKGATYEEIARRGGGILSTVRETRKASLDALVKSAKKRIQTAVSYGTTTIEIKSGYGLSLQSELKMLEAIRRLKKISPIDIVPTFLGAHTIPKNRLKNRDAHIKEITDSWLPAVARKELAEFCDIFCERGAFTPNETFAILSRAKALGFKLKAHTEQLSRSGGLQIALRLGATSVAHIDYPTKKDIFNLAQSDAVAVLLPGASFFLMQKHWAPARRMIDAGCAVSLGTDCNPGSSFTENMQFILALAAFKMDISIEEAISAATLNAACAVDRADVVGTLEAGKLCDVLLFEIPDYRHLIYHYGVNHISKVLKRGKIIWRNF